MMIEVLCKDKTHGFVEDSSLHDLISIGIVIAFYRPGPEEWVDTKNGNIRKKLDSPYAGPERRFSSKKLPPIHT